MDDSGVKVEASDKENLSAKNDAVVKRDEEALPVKREEEVLPVKRQEEALLEKDVEEASQQTQGSVPTKKEETKIENGSATKEETQLEEKIIRQIEYYFGDHNLVKDKFLQTKIKEDNGWVDLAVLMTFNRLKNLSESEEVIIAALRNSSNDLIEINNEKSKLRRNPLRPLPEKKENWRDEEMDRTIYAKGFPVSSTIDHLTDFFKGKGSVLNIFMRKKHNSKSFKGSVFATFATKEEAENFVKNGEQKFKNILLIKEMRRDYQKRKDEEYNKRKEERDKRKRERQEQKPDEEVAFNPEEDMEKGCILKLTGFQEGTTREDIKEKLNPHGKIAYVDFKIGDEVAYVRFEESGKAQTVLEKYKTGDEEDKKKLVIREADITAVVLEGEDEVAYWKKLVQARSHFNKDRRNSHKRGGRGGSRGRGGGRGGYGGRGNWNDRRGRGDFDRQSRKRGADPDSEGPSEKKEKDAALLNSGRKRGADPDSAGPSEKKEKNCQSEEAKA